MRDEELKEAPNFEAILDWVDQHRPDCSEHVRGLMHAARRKEKIAEASVFLLTIGFTAGRCYQEAHPDTDPNWGYHR